MSIVKPADAVVALLPRLVPDCYLADTTETDSSRMRDRAETGRLQHRVRVLHGAR